MPTRSSLRAIGASALLLAGCAGASPSPQRRAAPTDSATIEVRGDHGAERIAVAIDAASVDPENDHEVTSLGTRGAFMLVVDSYASRAQGLSRCQAGHESWVRLIDLKARTEKWSRLAQSCLHDIEPGDPIAAWTGRGDGFVVNAVSGPAARLSIRPDGRIDTVDQ